MTVVGVFRNYLFVVFLLCVTVTPRCFAENATAPDSVLIRNVTLIDQQESSEGVLVNILISDVLLDTKSYAVFAMQRGEILKNLLTDTPEPVASDADVPRKSGWLAYAPPSLALPMSYGDESKWNRWESKVVSGIFIAALLVDRQKWLGQDDASEQQVGDVTEFDGGEIRGIRFGAVGTLNFSKPWVYTLFAASNAFANG